MKTKLFIFSVALLLCSACSTPLSYDYHDDTTALWPAFSTTCDSVGYINAKGKMVIKPVCVDACFFSSGRAKVYRHDGGQQIIDKNGQVIYTCSTDEEVEDYAINGYFRFTNGRCAGLYDINFNVVIPAVENQDVGYMTRDGLIRLFKEENAIYTIHYVNIHGDTVLSLPKEYLYAHDFCDGRAVVFGRNWKYGAINKKGELVVDTIYEELYPAGANRLVYRNHNTYYGLIDTDGNVVTEPRFNAVLFFAENDLAAVVYPTTDGYYKMGWVDKNGNQQIAGSDFAYVTPFHDGVAWALVKHEDMEEYEYQLYDTKGNILLTTKEHTPISSFINGLCLVNGWDKEAKTEQHRYIDKKGNVVYNWNENRPMSDWWNPRLVKGAQTNASKIEAYEEMLETMFAGTEYAPLVKQRKELKQVLNHIEQFIK